MMGKKRKREIRQSSSFTDVIIQSRLSAASADAVAATTTAAVEACAGLWERAFGAAVSDVLSAPMLAFVGRSLLLRGEAVIVRADGQLVAGSSWDITGMGARPGTWRYAVDVSVPSGTLTVRTTGASVFHPRIGVEPARPWFGRSPLASMSESLRLLTAAESSLADELGGPVGHVLPVPSLDATTDDTGARLEDKLASLKGRTFLGETMAAGWGEGKTGAPTRDWQPARVGPDPSGSTVLLREQVSATVLAACGVPVELIRHSEGAGAREAWRRFLHGTIGPVGAMVGAEARRALGSDGMLSFDALFASDLAGRARAFQSLTGAGMDAALARQVCGF